MCDTHASTTNDITRRRLLGTGAAAAATVGTQIVGGAPSQAAAPSPPIRPASSDHDELITLGTAGGPPYQPGRCGIASALRTRGRTYLVDCGRGAFTQYGKAGLRLDELTSVFVTHLHADHVADYYSFFLLGGWGSHDDALTPPVSVYGPGPAGALPDNPRNDDAPTVAPEHPTPGIAALTHRCHQAYAYSHNIFMRDSGVPDVRSLLDVTEISVAGTGAGPHGPRAPEMEPLVLVDDGTVTVSATLVPHGPVFPSFAFRFDTDRTSVVFSGDTARSTNLIRLARGANVLVHEVIDLDYFHERGTDPAVLPHLEESHTPVDTVGEVAESAGVDTLVLSHLVPGGRGDVPPGRWRAKAQRGFTGRVVVADDLMRLAVG